jgi:hypothetical protein
MMKCRLADDDDKGFDHDVDVHVQIDRLARNLQSAAQPGQEGADEQDGCE